MFNSSPILPGATLGVLGSGQLGRLFVQAATRLGYRVHVFSQSSKSPAGQVAHFEMIADYTDIAALTAFGRSVDIVTLEFENIPVTALETLQKIVPVRPGPTLLRITQNRVREKRFLQQLDIPCAPFAEVNSSDDLHHGVAQLGLPCVLKTADSGYDGKGQALLRTAEDELAAWQKVDQQPSVLEAWVDYQQEFSILVARSTEGEIVTCGPIANDHANHILDVSRFPAHDLDAVTSPAERYARQIAEHLELVGIACVEMFLARDGSLLVNEIAPRPHNSGHLTIEACPTSQFEQQVRAICGLALGSMQPTTPAAMVNLLGDLWYSGEPNWQVVEAFPEAYLHLYGKTEPKTGRKMGHLTVLAESAELAAQAARKLREKLPSGPQTNDS